MDTVVFPTSVMSVEDIFEFVVNYYGSDPVGKRSINPDLCSSDANRCLYNGPGGRMCGFRLFVRDDKASLLTEGSRAAAHLRDHTDLLRPEVADLFRYDADMVYPIVLWDNVQKLHDTDHHWDGGLDVASGRVQALIGYSKDRQIPKHERWANRGRLALEVSKAGESSDVVYDYWYYDVHGVKQLEGSGVSETMVGACENIVRELQQQNRPYPSVKELTACIETENNHQHLDWDSTTAFL